MCDMTQSYEWRDTFIWVTWHIHMSDMTHWFSSAPTRDASLMCDMTHEHDLLDSSIWVTWHIHRSGMPHSYEWHVTFIWVTWHIHMSDMTYSYEWHDTFIWVTWHIDFRALLPETRRQMSSFGVWNGSVWFQASVHTNLPFNVATYYSFLHIYSHIISPLPHPSTPSPVFRSIMFRCTLLHQPRVVKKEATKTRLTPSNYHT